MMGLLCARQYFDRDTREETAARSQISSLWNEVEWSWFTRGGQEVLSGIGADARLGHESPDSRLERVP
jgi:hypothetical protein